jgi:hypothetical protein
MVLELMFQFPSLEKLFLDHAKCFDSVRSF